LGLVTTIIPAAPKNMKKLRSAIEAEAPKADFNCVASPERRETISPVFSESKKEASSEVTWANTSPRNLATTSSPSVMTK
jgi:hypothetical protein